MDIRVLSAKDLDRALPMDQAIEINEKAFSLFSQNKTLTPQRLHLDLPKGTNLLKPAYIPQDQILSLKVVNVFPQNLSKNLDTIQGLVMLFDPETGQILSLINGKRLTSIRTGAAAGCATKHLALPHAANFALLGAGGMALDQARAVIAVRPINQIKIFSPSGSSAKKLAQIIAKEYPHINVKAVDEAQKAVSKAEVITCITTSQVPVFEPKDLKPGTHINGMGSFTPEAKEVEIKGLKRLKIFVDSKESALNEAGDLIQALNQNELTENDFFELGSLINKEGVGREDPFETTFFKSVGLGCQDALTAQAAFEKAKKMHLGSLITL